MDASLVPAPTSDLHGRADQLAALVGLLVDRGARLVTLTGAGGSGKTRLSIEVARRVQDHFADGAAFVRLSAVRDPGVVAAEVSRQMGIASPARGDPIDPLRAVLRRRDMLLVLDNFEQVTAAADVVSGLTETCPGLRVLVTSRRPLRLTGERVVVVPPLGLVAEPAAESPAVALFCERASAVDSDFVRTPELLESISEICRRLDGLPLAIELAAARSRTLPAGALLTRLAAAGPSPWHLLNRAPADASQRHKSLYDAIAWSVDLLEPAEAVLFRRLGVFEGTWSIEAAEAVCAGAGPGAPPAVELAASDIVDALSVLVDIHLVEPVRSDSPTPRFGFLDTIRLAARQALAQAGEAVDLGRRHAEHFLAMMVEAGVGLEGPQESRWYAGIDAEIAELRAALTWLDGAGRAADVVTAAGALGPYWLNRGQFADGRRWLTRATGTAVVLPVEVAAKARGWSARLDLDGAASVATAEEADALVVELEDVRIVMSSQRDRSGWLRACDHLSYALRIYGDVERAWSVTHEALDRCREPSRRWWRSEHLLRGALLAEQRGDAAVSREYAAEALAAARAAGNDRVRARATQALLLAEDAGDAAALQAGLLGVLAASQAFGDRRGAAATMAALGAVTATVGDLRAAASWFAGSIAESREIGYRNGVALGVAGVAGLAGESREWATAACLHGALARHLPTLRGQLTRRYAAAYDEDVEHARRAIGPSAFHAEAARGAELDWESAVDVAVAQAQALAAGPPARTASVAPPRTAEPDARLSPREREILALVTDGLTNPEIAHVLYVSPKTVMHHTSAIYRKLGVRGRAEAVAHAVRSRAPDDVTSRTGLV